MARTRPKLPLIFNQSGYGNQLMVLVDFSNADFLRDTLLREQVDAGLDLPASQIEREFAVLASLNNKGSTAHTLFGDPIYSDFLIWDVRAPEETRRNANANTPSEILERYLLLTYDTVDAAIKANERVRSTKGLLAVEVDRKMTLAGIPNDPYAQVDTADGRRYQWGLHAMNFIKSVGTAAHDHHKGHGYVAVLDGIGGGYSVPSDLSPNFRSHMSNGAVSSGGAYGEFHGLLVNSIVAASTNNGSRVAGGCPSCSLMVANGSDSASGSAQGLNSLVVAGAPTVNMSFGNGGSSNAFTTALASAALNDVAMIAASGNENVSVPNFPANNVNVLAVGGVEKIGQNEHSAWVRWAPQVGTGSTAGSNYTGINGVVAAARHVVGLAPTGASLIPGDAFLSCGDGTSPVDVSGTANDGVAACTGTSFATPHVTALAALMRSINPRLPATSVYSLIRSSGSQAGSPTSAIGNGMPNALTAVDTVISQTPNSLTPLFSMWSYERSDYFYTTVPQMATAAYTGYLLPWHSAVVGYQPGLGNPIRGYSAFPMNGSSPVPTAGAWIFTTTANPKDASTPLVPLFRMSWKCGDYTPMPPTLCSSQPYHIDTTYTTDQAGINAFQSAGYKVDGIEGFIYPKTIPQPTGTVRLMRKYAPGRDDHAIFPETDIYNYTLQGYTQNTGSDWLGYVYPNSNGTVPVIQ